MATQPERQRDPPAAGSGIELLPGEQVVMSSNGGILTLTTRRVRYDSSAIGSSALISITLESVASCGFVTRSFPILLVLSALAALGAIVGISGNSTSEAWGLFVVAAILAILYLVTRKSVLAIASNGGQVIRVLASGASRSSLVEFIEALEREKLR